jgi:nitric oxide reductase large subunit
MNRDIGRQWGFPKGQDVLAITGELFGIVGAFAIALFAWLFVFLLGLAFPAMRALCISAALFALTWTLGQASHHFYSSGRPRISKTADS